MSLKPFHVKFPLPSPDTGQHKTVAGIWRVTAASADNTLARAKHATHVTGSWRATLGYMSRS